MEVNVYLLKSKENSKGKAPLRLHVGSYIKIPLGVSVTVKNWDEDKQRVTTKEEFYFRINEKIQNKINKVNYYLAGNTNPNEEDIRLLVEAKEEKEEAPKVAPKKQITVYEYIDLYIKHLTDLNSGGHLRNLISAKDHLKELKPKLKWEEVNKKLLQDYTKYLINVIKRENTTILGYINKLKKVFSEAREDGYPVNKNIKDFTFKTGTYKPFQITWEEVDKIDKVNHFNPKYNEVKDSFVFRCNTGLRDSDYSNLNKHSFVKRNGSFYIKINTEKTVEDQYLILNARALQIVKKYDFILPQFAQQDFNRIIKYVARAAKIEGEYERIRHVGNERKVTIVPRYKMVSSKICRNIFARHWYDLGGDIRLIAHFLGHEKESQTRHYIGLDDDDTNSEMIRVFDQGEIFK